MLEECKLCAVQQASSCYVLLCCISSPVTIFAAVSRGTACTRSCTAAILFHNRVWCTTVLSGTAQQLLPNALFSSRYRLEPFSITATLHGKGIVTNVRFGRVTWILQGSNTWPVCLACSYFSLFTHHPERAFHYLPERVKHHQQK